jgi:hypothetical protein
MEREIIEKIIEAANQAPSGSNSQPWKFRVKDNVIEVIALPEKDHPILNFKNRGTYLAHGALIENVEIAAHALGYRATFDVFPEKDISARITLESSTEKKDTDWYNIIFNRHSNRKCYKVDQLNEEEKNYLFQEINKFPQCKLLIADTKNEISRISKSLASDILVFLQNKLLHKLLFQEIIWKEEEQKYRPGLYVKTMEMAGPKALVFKILKNWKVIRFFNKINLPQKIYKENVKTVSSSGLIGVVVVQDEDINFIEAGRLMENIWLRASKLNLGFQLITGILFLWQQVNFGKQDIFSEKEKEVINKAYENIKDIFKIKDEIIALAFRVGKANAPLAVSYKRPPIVEWDKF